MTLYSKMTTTVAAVALFTLSAGPGFAASEAEMTAALQKAFTSAPDTSVELGTPTVDGDDFVYSNVKVKAGGAAPNETTIGTLTLTDADLNADGGIKAASITGEGIKSTGDGSTVDLANFEVVNPDFVSPPSADQPGKGKFDSLTLTDMTVTEQGKPPVTVGSISLETADYVDDVPRSLSLAVEELVIDPATFDDGGEGAAQLKAYGYDKLTLGIFGAGDWDADAGTLTFEELTIEGADAGSISLAATLGGLTQDVMAKLQQPNPPPEVMQEITVVDAALTYVDASLAGRVLDVQAKELGQPREAFVEQISGALPLMLMALQNPAFQDKVATAVGTFLKDPQNLTVSVAPDQPVSVMQIMTEAQTSPQTLPDTLKAEVEANAALEQ